MLFVDCSSNLFLSSTPRIGLATAYGLGIGTSTFLEFNKQIQPSSNNEKIVLSCPCYSGDVIVVVIWNFEFSEMWVAHEFGSVKTKAGAHYRLYTL